MATSTTSSNTSLTIVAGVSTLAPGTAVPVGVVAFFIDGAFVANVTLNANGRASLTLPAGLPAGYHTLTVQYQGNSDFNVSQASETIDFILGRGT
jgi:hypothetical protein